MLYELAADLVAAVHAAFVLFVVFGFALGRASRGWRSAHLAATVYGLLIEIWAWPCPLTYVENWLRAASGRPPYSEAFIAHYLNQLIYIEVQQWILVAAAGVIAVVNVGLYLSRPAGTARKSEVH